MEARRSSFNERLINFKSATGTASLPIRKAVTIISAIRSCESLTPQSATSFWIRLSNSGSPDDENDVCSAWMPPAVKSCTSRSRSRTEACPERSKSCWSLFAVRRSPFAVHRFRVDLRLLISDFLNSVFCLLSSNFFSHSPPAPDVLFAPILS